MLGASAAGQEVLQDQVSSNRSANTPSRGAIESELDQVLYILKVNGASGGTVNGGTIYGDVYQAGSSVTVTAIPNSGQQFVRWDYVLGGSGTASTSNPYTFAVNQNVTLIPVFNSLAAGSYTLTYVGNENTSGNVPAGGIFTAATTISGQSTLVKDGYSFLGWNSSSNGSGVSYQPGANYSSGTNLTLYAIWEETTIIASPTASNQSVCSGAIVSDLVATGTDLKWYSVAEGGVALNASTVLTETTYYVSQTVGGVESSRTAVVVTITQNIGSISLISGPTPLASDATTASYSVTPVSGASSYVWNLPSGLTITSQTGPSVTVAVSSAFRRGDITVKAVNDCGETVVRSFTVRKTSAPAGGIAFSVAGNSILCSNETYTATSVADGVYSWSVPTGVTIISGEGTNAITVSTDANFVSGRISVTCNTPSVSLNTSILVSGVLQPSVISGPSDLCGVTTATYSVVSEAGLTYVWSVPSGMVITSAQDGASINVSVAEGTNGTVAVQAESSCGLSLERKLAVNAAPLLGGVTGVTLVCGALEATFDTSGNPISNTFRQLFLQCSCSGRCYIL